jgi:hypothetical protein
MATVLEVVSRSLRLLAVLDARQPPTADDIRDGTISINRMMQRWEADGTAIGWTPVWNPTDTLTVPEEILETVEYNLAVRLAPQYDREPSQTVAAMATEGLSNLLRDRVVEMPLEQTLDTPLGFRSGKYDTLTDTWRR